MLDIVYAGSLRTMNYRSNARRNMLVKVSLVRDVELPASVQLATGACSRRFFDRKHLVGISPMLRVERAAKNERRIIINDLGRDEARGPSSSNSMDLSQGESVTKRYAR